MSESMIDILKHAETFMPAWLDDGVTMGWNSLDINYHPPFVERLWREWRGFRVYLHRIKPCETSEALMHPHPWPSAVRVLEGSYEMGVGHAAGDQPSPVALRLRVDVTASSFGSDFYYEMTDPDGWHYVRPIGYDVWSVMITGAPWKRQLGSTPRSDIALSPLDPDRFEENLEYFRGFYGSPR